MSRRKSRIKRKWTLQKWGQRLLGLALAAVLLLSLVHLTGFVTSRVNELLVCTETSVEGCIEKGETARAVVINKENEITAPAMGHFENLLVERERVRNGGLIGLIYPEGDRQVVPVVAPCAGVVCFHPDGLGGKASAYSLEKDGPSILDWKPRNPADISFLKPGNVICRVVDNFAPSRVVVVINSAYGDKLSPGRSILVHLQKDDLGEAVCEGVRTEQNLTTAVLRFNEFRPELLDVRHTQVKLIWEHYSGIIVPEAALTERRGEPGVYFLRGQTVFFKPVSVICREEGRAVVDGIDAGESVVTTPRLVKEGMTCQTKGGK